MSTPGSFDGSEPDQSGTGHAPDPFAETMSRPLPQYDPSSPGQYSQQQYPQQEYPQQEYPQQEYPQQEYPQQQYPQQQYSPTQFSTPYQPMSGQATNEYSNQQYQALTYEPAPRGGGAGRAVLLGIVIACVIGLVVAAVVVWMKVANTGDTATGPGTDPGSTVADTQPETTVTSVVVDPETAASTSLAETAATDAASVRSSYNNQWTAQISAKRPGLEAEGRRWDNQAIWSEFTSFRSTYPQVKLLNSSDWPVFSESGWWITVSAQNFSSPQAALSWCAANRLDRDHCFAKLVSSTRGPEGTTLYQR